MAGTGGIMRKFADAFDTRPATRSPRLPNPVPSLRLPTPRALVSVLDSTQLSLSAGWVHTTPISTCSNSRPPSSKGGGEIVERYNTETEIHKQFDFPLDRMRVAIGHVLRKLFHC